MAKTKRLLVARHLRGLTDQPDFDAAAWPDADAGALDDEALATYVRRRDAVTLYLGGASDRELRSKVKMGVRQVNHLIRERCMQAHPDGRIYGWRGLIKHARVVGYVRTKTVKVDARGYGAAGALQALLRNEPDFARRLDRHILKTCKPSELGETRRSRIATLSWFLAELRKLNYEARNLWPFNVQTFGYTSLARYVDRVLAANPWKAALIVGGPEVKRKLRTGDGVDRPVSRAYQRVEMDAHKLDCRLCVLIPQMDGGWSPKIVHRLWVTVILDVVTRAVLGYFLSTGWEVTKNDVLRAIKCALSRWVKPAITYSDKAYLDEADLASSRNEDYVGLCWDETSVDGALAETCKTVAAKLTAVVKSTIVEPSSGFSARRSPDDRPFIEAFFRTLSQRGMDRLTNSTGNKPSSKRGRDPDQVAVLKQFQLPYLEELLAVMIANYNATPHHSLGYRTPLQMLDFFAAQGCLPDRRADPALVRSLLSVRKACTVKGGYAEGRAPYVNFSNGHYSSDALASRHDLVGQTIHVSNHIEDDARVALASTLDGTPLGVLRVAPPWSRLPHTLEIRSAIASMVKSRVFVLANGGDAIMSFLTFVESNGRGKLPVHPSYLALQRLLSVYARNSTVETDVSTTLDRLAMGDAVRQNDASTFGGKVRAAHRDATKSAEISASTIEQAASSSNGLLRELAPASSRNRPLPLPRMAANR